MSISRNATFSVEVWAQIMQHCSVATLKSLALVSRGCCIEARRLIYQSVWYREGRRFGHEAIAGTRIRDLRIFYQTLTTWTRWRDRVQNISIEWSNGNDIVFDEAPFGPETEHEAQYDELIQNIIRLLSESAKLKVLHLAPPLLTSVVPFAAPGVTSLTIPLTGSLQNIDDPGYTRLLRFFQLPSLQRVELDCMLRLNIAVPRHCCQPGTSNVTTIVFKECGPISKEIEDLLRWPRDLRILHFDISVPMYLKNFASYNAPFLNKTVIETLLPMSNSLQELSIWASDILDEPLQRGAFQPFTKLRRLRVPSDMLLMFYEYFRLEQADYENAPPINTQLPCNLEVFEVEVARSDFYWNIWDSSEGWTVDLTEFATELLDWLSGLSQHKPCCLPNLWEVHIWVNDPDEGYTPEENPEEFPGDCQATQQFLRQMRTSDITVYFH